MLKNIPLFSNLPDADLEELSSHAVTKTFPKNTVVLSEGDTTDSLYVIVAGKVKVFLRDERGKEVILNILDPGEYFGEIALLDEAPRSASVMTLEHCTFSVITKADFRNCLGKNPDIAVNLIRDLTHRVRALTDNVKSLALEDVYRRIAKTLLHLAQEEDGKLVVQAKLTQQDMASMVGASREMVSRIFRDLAVGGYIEIEDKKITIKGKLPPGW